MHECEKGPEGCSCSYLNLDFRFIFVVFLFGKGLAQEFGPFKKGLALFWALERALHVLVLA